MVASLGSRSTTIKEFPIYEITDGGEIYNTRTRQYMRTSQTTFGHVKITLTDFDGSRHTRSVALMVAEAFVQPPNFMCDTLIILDGNFLNLHADNLAWRPYGFAWKYTHQLKSHQPDYYYNLPVRNLITGAEYESILVAGITEGLLFDDIWESTYRGTETFPEGSVFEVIK